MQFSQEHSNSAYIIKSYTKEMIRVIRPLSAEILREAENEPDKINELRHLNVHQSTVISVEDMLSDWPPRTVAELRNEHIEMILTLTPEIVLLGTGERLVWPQPQVLQPLIERGIGYEVMTTAAACRTYNVLMHEGRRIAVALML